MHDDFIQLLPFFFFSPVVGGWGREEEINGQCVRKQTHVWILKFVVKHWRWQLLYVLTFTSICGLGWYIIIIKQMGLGGLHNKRLKSSFVLQLPNSLEAAGVPTLLPAWNFGMYIYIIIVLACCEYGSCWLQISVITLLKYLSLVIVGVYHYELLHIVQYIWRLCYICTS